MMRIQYRDAKIVVKCFFKFLVGQEIQMPPKELVG
jgi:hypothetical protein